MTSDQPGISAAGGWFAPSETLYGMLPDIQIERGGIPYWHYEDDGTILVLRSGRTREEQRLFDRLCKCGQRADATHKAPGSDVACEWQPAYSAELARDLTRYTTTMVSASIAAATPTWRERVHDRVRRLADWTERWSDRHLPGIEED